MNIVVGIAERCVEVRQDRVLRRPAQAGGLAGLALRVAHGVEDADVVEPMLALT